MYKVEFSKEERDAVLPQIASRLTDLEELMAKAGENKDTGRVLELAKFIEHIRDFYIRMMNV